MKFRIFTLHPQIFNSFTSTALVARAIDKEIIEVETVNWREGFGLGNYKQIDDTPFGGGSGMVLMAEPIFRAMESVEAVSTLFQRPKEKTDHQRILPNNSKFYSIWLEKIHQRPIKKVSISLTPRGFPLTQEVVEWLTEFEEINLLAGRYEGFDARVSEFVDLELSVGNFILNGGEVAAMSVVESVSRLMPGFVGKERCTTHDSFSTSLNYYSEEEEFFIGKRQRQRVLESKPLQHEVQVHLKEQLFDDEWWVESLALQLEHPHYTRPENWQNWLVPEFLGSGNHKKIQDWRMNWWKV